MDWDFTYAGENIYIHDSQDNMILEEVQAIISFDRAYTNNAPSSFAVKPSLIEGEWIRYDFYGEVKE